MADHECHLIAKVLKALEPFASTTITDSGQIIGLMREDFKRASSVITEARAAIAKATGEDARLIAAEPELLFLVRGLVDLLGNCSVESGVCCCGDDMRSHADPMNCGHSPVDSGAYAALSLYERAVEVLAKAAGEEPFMTDQNNLPRSMLRERVHGFTVQTTADHLDETITQRTTAPGLDDVIGNASHLIAMSVCHLQDVQTREALIKMGWLPPEEAGALKAQVVGARITSGAVSEGGDHD